MMDAKLAALGLGWITSTIGIVFWVLVIGLLFVIVRFIRRKDYLLASVTCVPLAALFVLPVMSYMEQREYLAKYEPAKAIFDKLCKEQSAPIIKRTVEDVEGVLLLKVRPDSFSIRHQQVADQLWEGAGLPTLPHGKRYLLYFLRDRKLDDKYSNKIRNSIGAADHRRGFRYVEVRDVATGATTRFIAKMVQEPSVNQAEAELFEAPLKSPAARYAIDLIDNIDPALREHWIAGTTIRIIDTVSKEIVAEQTWWNWDPGFGNANQRSPWLLGKSCPRDKAGDETGHLFIDSVLIAKQGS